MDFSKFSSEFQSSFVNLVKYGFPTIAIGLSILSYRLARKTYKVQERLNDIEEKLKNYELEEKEKEREEATKACVEARVVQISKNKYKMKIWNSGKATACNVDFKIPEDYIVDVWRDHVPYEFLEPGKSFEELVVVHDETSQKFKIITTWKDEKGILCSKEQICTI